jgi:hydrogenase maturation factor
VGEDVAAVQLNPEEEVVVLKSDPITFSTTRLGYYSVVVSANDIATAGARPRWLLATLLLPVGTNAAQAQAMIAEINDFCIRYDIQLSGGHTEITDAVTQPVVVAQLTGTVAKTELLDKRLIERGDRILMTKSVAIEGTATIAREFPCELCHLGLSEGEVAGAQQLLEEPGISILHEAQIVSQLAGVIALHDVTEGGIATALDELSLATGRKILVDPSRISILPATKRICRVLGIDPLGLIGSGSLLIVCRESASDVISARLRAAGIPFEVLGWATDAGRGIDLKDSDEAWPQFETDEISRAFAILSSLKESPKS